VTLYDAKLQEDNTFVAFLDFEDGTRLGVEFASDSPAVAQLLDLLTRLVTEKLAELGSRGVVITRVTSDEEQE
jgi:hypothetical protein